MSDILDISKELLGLGSTLAKAQHERRAALADYLVNVANCIENITKSVSIPENHSYREFCAELEVCQRLTKFI